MDAKHFASFFESVTQMGEIVHGAREPSREFHIDAIGVTDIRKATGLSQAKFATLIDVQVGTLRNWQKRCQGQSPGHKAAGAVRKWRSVRGSSVVSGTIF